MRLIDADALLNVLENEAGILRLYEIGIEQMIEQSPTAYDVDKVVEQMECLKTTSADIDTTFCKERKKEIDCHSMDCFGCYITKMLEIVKGGGIDGRN